MKLDKKLFDEILLQAQESPRRRMNFDLRTQAQIPGQAGNGVKGGAGNDGEVYNKIISNSSITNKIIIFVQNCTL